MQVIWQCNLNPREYQTQFDKLSFPVQKLCPNCKRKKTLKSHGTYYRNVIDCPYSAGHECIVVFIQIKRLFCSACHKTCSLLPSFAVPKFQCSVKFILQCLQCIFLSMTPNDCFYRQLRYFYKLRFMKIKNINCLCMLFRILKYYDIFPEDRYKKATKLVVMLGAHPHVTDFLRSLHRIYNHSFMAK